MSNGNPEEARLQHILGDKPDLQPQLLDDETIENNKKLILLEK